MTLLNDTVDIEEEEERPLLDIVRDSFLQQEQKKVINR